MRTGSCPQAERFKCAPSAPPHPCRVVRVGAKAKANPRPLVGVRVALTCWIVPGGAGPSLRPVWTDHPLPRLASSPRGSAARGLAFALPAPVRFLCGGYPVNLSSGQAKAWTYKQVAPEWSVWGIIGVLGLVLASNACPLHHPGVISPAREITDSRIMHLAGALFLWSAPRWPFSGAGGPLPPSARLHLAKPRGRGLNPSTASLGAYPAPAGPMHAARPGRMLIAPIYPDPFRSGRVYGAHTAEGGGRPLGLSICNK